MFNKFAKSIRWIVLAGMLYTLYVMFFKDNLEFNNQSDPKVLIQLAKKSSKSRDTFVIYKRLISLYPENEEYEKLYDEAMKKQANKIIDAHEKMLLPVAIGNYRYVNNVKFGKDGQNKYVLILNMTTIFGQQGKSTKNTLKNMFNITHNGIYTHYGFDDGMRLLLVPDFDTLDDIKIIDLDRKTLELPEMEIN